MLFSIRQQFCIFVAEGAKPMCRTKLVFLTLVISISFWGGHPAWAQTKPEGKSLRFNGIDQHLSIQNHSHFNIAAGESYTVSLRICPDKFSAPYTILSKGNNLIPGSRYELSTAKTVKAPNLSLNLRNSEDTNLGAQFVTVLQPGHWVHIAWVYQSGSKSSKIYIDGQLVNTVIHSDIGRRAIENLNELTLGCGWTDASSPERYQFWPGQIDELRIWKRALAADEVKADCTTQAASVTELVASWNFESIYNNIVPDVSGKGHNGQLYGYGIRVIKTLLPVGIGEVNERLTGFRINAESPDQTISSIVVDFSGTSNLSALSALKIYHNGSAERFNLKTATLFGTSAPVKARTVVSGNMKLNSGDNYIWVTGDISAVAREGNQIFTSVISYTTNEGTTVSVPPLPGSRTVLLTNKLLYSGGDAGSMNYRIPAIVTAKDGTLITATDKRWTGPFDLPKHIDVLIRRSTDKGCTWSAPFTLAGEGTDVGFGDPALVVNRKNGEIICLFASGRGFFQSTAASPIRIYQSKSGDMGLTWSAPQDLTAQIYGAGCPNPVTQNWQGAFVTSGNAVQLKSGRLMAVLPVRETTGRNITNFVLYSDDHAKTWKVSPNRASSNGNEAKMVGLENGQILMSIRSEGGFRMFNLSKDQGMTWGMPYAQTSIVDPYCNGDMIRYTAVSEGYNRNRLLHSTPWSSLRNNISVLLSYDEGVTWPLRKTIYSGASAYSSLCILNDGTIGMYYEAGEYETYQMYFVRFSLNWLSGGADYWIEKRNNLINSTGDLAEVSSSLKVYPNPATEFITVAGNFESGTGIVIFNIQGTLVRMVQATESGTPVQISLEGIPSGIYFVKVAGQVEKIVVQ